jgi:hypothetical protein
VTPLSPRCHFLCLRVDITTQMTCIGVLRQDAHLILQCLDVPVCGKGIATNHDVKYVAS